MKKRRYRPRQLRNQPQMDRFVQDVRKAIQRLGPASRLKATPNLYGTLQRAIRPHFDKFAGSIEDPIDFEEWCEANIPAIIEEIENAEDEDEYPGSRNPNHGDDHEPTAVLLVQDHR